MRPRPVSEAPTVIVIGGPNGAGKTTVSRDILADTLGITEFVNADTIAAGLSGFEPQRAAFAAGRIMLLRLRELAAARRSFAFESTLSSRTLAPWLGELRRQGWEMYLVYIWVRSVRISIRRIHTRVRLGGHNVPEHVLRRRHGRSATNFWHLYRPLASSWQAYDNSGRTVRLIAVGETGEPAAIIDRSRFTTILEYANAGEETES